MSADIEYNAAFITWCKFENPDLQLGGGGNDLNAQMGWLFCQEAQVDIL